MRASLIFLLLCLLAGRTDAQVIINGDFGMTGIVVSQNGDFRVVERVLPHSPAEGAGIKPGDLVLAINDTGTKGLELNDYLSKIRGDPGSEVALAVRDHATGVVFSYTLKRVSMRAYYEENPAVQN